MGRRAIATAALMAALVGTAGRIAQAQAPGPLQVAVDWSLVHDADVQRCGLSRLRAGTIERLVDNGHAVVEAVDERGVQVAVASSPSGLHVRVASADVVREDTLPVDASCDATLVLDVIARIAERVEEVARLRPASAAQPEPSAQAPSESGPTTDLQASLDLTGRLNASPDLTLGGGVGLRARLPSRFELGGRLELTGNGALGVTVLEGFLGLGVAYQPERPGLGPHLELGPLLHLASSDERSVLELDALLAAGVQATLGHLLAQVLVYGRARRFEHRVGGETAFDTGQFGLLVRVGAQLSGS